MLHISDTCLLLSSTFLLHQEKFIILDIILPSHTWRQLCTNCFSSSHPVVCRHTKWGDEALWVWGASDDASPKPLKNVIPLDAQ